MDTTRAAADTRYMSDPAERKAEEGSLGREADLDLTSKRQRQLNSPVEKVFAISGLKMVILGFLGLGQKQWVQLSAVDRTWFAFCRTKECLKLVVFKPAKSITDQGLQALSSLASLQRLNLNDCEHITDQGLQALSSLASLQSLNLSWCSNITDQGVQALVASMRSLTCMTAGLSPRSSTTWRRRSTSRFLV